ncbi:MAG: tRNA (cytidine(34)-2'-O)-methyltransferase [Pseudomonadota bacterium]
MFNVILHQPEIPPNTGNIIRLCANTGTTLNLIRPLGFELSEKRLRRAGLDYHDMANVQEFDSLDECLEALETPRTWVLTTHATRPYTEATFAPGDALLFGSETKGLPDAVRETHREACLRLPMVASNRSLNLSNSVAVVVYEAWRQQGFAGA